MGSAWNDSKFFAEKAHISEISKKSNCVTNHSTQKTQKTLTFTRLCITIIFGNGIFPVIQLTLLGIETGGVPHLDALERDVPDPAYPLGD